MVKPLKENASEEDIQKREKDIEAAQPKAKRIIILIRHGQYNIKATHDYDRYLTGIPI